MCVYMIEMCVILRIHINRCSRPTKDEKMYMQSENLPRKKTRNGFLTCRIIDDLVRNRLWRAVYTGDAAELWALSSLIRRPSLDTNGLEVEVKHASIKLCQLHSNKISIARRNGSVFQHPLHPSASTALWGPNPTQPCCPWIRSTTDNLHAFSLLSGSGEG